VRELTTGLLDEGRTLVTDNFYTSIPLARYLLSHNTHLIGTLRSNRKGLPEYVTRAKLKRGGVVGSQDEQGIKVLHWVDKRSVHMLTTIPEHEATLVDTGRQRRGEPVKKPECVVQYNRLKKGVDISDQLSSYYTPLRKTLRWYKKMAVELLAGTAVVNAYLLYTELSRSTTLLQFREDLARALLGPLEEVFSPNRSSNHPRDENQAGSRTNST